MLLKFTLMQVPVQPKIKHSCIPLQSVGFVFKVVGLPCLMSTVRTKFCFLQYSCMMQKSRNLFSSSSVPFGTCECWMDRAGMALKCMPVPKLSMNARQLTHEVAFISDGQLYLIESLLFIHSTSNARKLGYFDLTSIAVAMNICQERIHAVFVHTVFL